MDDRTNTTAGWVLFSGIVALGLASLSGRYFHANKNERPEKMGYEIAGVVREGAEGAAKEESIEARLAKADPAKGAASFAKCKSCHTDAQGGANGIGPNLFGVVGEAVATGRGGFAFSDDLKKVNDILLAAKPSWKTFSYDTIQMMAAGDVLAAAGPWMLIGFLVAGLAARLAFRLGFALRLLLRQDVRELRCRRRLDEQQSVVDVDSSAKLSQCSR